jgi:hypothetical protein
LKLGEHLDNEISPPGNMLVVARSIATRTTEKSGVDQALCKAGPGPHYTFSTRKNSTEINVLRLFVKTVLHRGLER